MHIHKPGGLLSIRMQPYLSGSLFPLTFNYTYQSVRFTTLDSLVPGLPLAVYKVSTLRLNCKTFSQLHVL